MTNAERWVNDISKGAGTLCYCGEGTPLSLALANVQQMGFSLDAKLTRQARTIALLTDDRRCEKFGLAVRGQRWPSEPTNLVLTYAAGSDPSFWVGVKVFAASLKEHIPNCDKVVLTHEMSLEIREWLQDEGFMVWDIEPTKVTCLVRDRCFAFANWLSRWGFYYRRALICDSKDVLFQGDIFEHYDMSWNGFDIAVAFSEGAKHRQIPWNMEEQRKYREAVGLGFECYGEWDILNGGILYGTPLALVRLEMMVGESTLWVHDKGATCSDQAVLNHLYRHGGGDLHVVHPREEPLVAHGEAIKQGVFEIPTSWHGGRLINDSDFSTFLLFHQWDRTKYHIDVMRKYNLIDENT